MPVLPVRGVEGKRQTLQQESSMELEVTGAAHCTENFLRLLHLFSSPWHANALALQRQHAARALKQLHSMPDAKKTS